MIDLLFLLAAYALGCVSFALLAARARGVDLRSGGSGNPGATNVGRVLGPGWGTLVLALDIAKGWVAVTFLPSFAGVLDPAGQAPALGAVVLGHIFPLTSRFRGGKGVAALVGGMLAMDPWLALASLVARAAVKRFTGFVSVSSVVLVWTFPVLQYLAGPTGLGQPRPQGNVVVASGLALLITLRHRDNFRRVLAGTEDRYDGPDPQP